MKTRQRSDFQVEFDGGGGLSRRRTKLLPGGAYSFEDYLEVDGILTATIVTCAAWLMELYRLRAGELFFVSGDENIRPTTKRFGVFYPPFSITQVSFNKTKGHLLGIAAAQPLPPDVVTVPSIFETTSSGLPSNLTEALAVLKTGENHQPVEMKPKPSLLALKAKRLIDESYLGSPSIARIAARLGVTHEHLSRQFKRDFGMSPSVYFHKLRVADAPLKLAWGEEIINVSQDLGYNDLSGFYRQFRKTTDTSPGACKAILRRQRT